MTLSSKKNCFIIIFALFFCFDIYPISYNDGIQNVPVLDVGVSLLTDGSSSDCGDCTIQETPTERYESFTVHTDGYDIKIEAYHNYETGDSLYRETILEHENTHIFDTELPDVIIPNEPLVF